MDKRKNTNLDNNSMVMMTFQYMVNFTMPDVLSETFLSLIPQQRNLINRYFQEGKLVNYALSLENSKIWAVFRAENEMEVLEWVADLPLSEYMDIEVNNLTFFNAMQPKVPEFSLN